MNHNLSLQPINPGNAPIMTLQCTFYNLHLHIHSSEIFCTSKQLRHQHQLPHLMPWFITSYIYKNLWRINNTFNVLLLYNTICLLTQRAERDCYWLTFHFQRLLKRIHRWRLLTTKWNIIISNNPILFTLTEVHVGLYLYVAQNCL